MGDGRSRELVAHGGSIYGPLLQLLIPPIMQFFSALQLIEGF